MEQDYGLPILERSAVCREDCVEITPTLDRAWEQKRKGNNASSSSSNNASRVIIIFITTIHFIEIENERKFLCTVYIYVC